MCATVMQDDISSLSHLSSIYFYTRCACIRRMSVQYTDKHDGVRVEVSNDVISECMEQASILVYSLSFKNGIIS